MGRGRWLLVLSLIMGAAEIPADRMPTVRVRPGTTEGSATRIAPAPGSQNGPVGAEGAGGLLRAARAGHLILGIGEVVASGLEHPARAVEAMAETAGRKIKRALMAAGAGRALLYGAEAVGGTGAATALTAAAGALGSALLVVKTAERTRTAVREYRAATAAQERLLRMAGGTRDTRLFDRRVFDLIEDLERKIGRIGRLSGSGTMEELRRLVRELEAIGRNGKEHAKSADAFEKFLGKEGALYRKSSRAVKIAESIRYGGEKRPDFDGAWRRLYRLKKRKERICKAEGNVSEPGREMESAKREVRRIKALVAPNTSYYVFVEMMKNVIGELEAKEREVIAEEEYAARQYAHADGDLERIRERVRKWREADRLRREAEHSLKRLEHFPSLSEDLERLRRRLAAIAVPPLAEAEKMLKKAVYVRNGVNRWRYRMLRIRKEFRDRLKMLRYTLNLDRQYEGEILSITEKADRRLEAIRRCIAAGRPAEAGAFSDEGTVVVGDNRTTRSASSETKREEQSAFVEEETRVVGERSGEEMGGFEEEETRLRPPERGEDLWSTRDWMPESWRSGESGSTRVNIYLAASAIAQAAVLARYTDGRADGMIEGLLADAAKYMEAANRTSFAPHKAWPEWRERRRRMENLRRRAFAERGGRAELFRRQLARGLETELASMEEQLKTITPARTGGVENCDTVIFGIGRHLAAAAQLKMVEEAARKAGAPRRWLRKLEWPLASHLQSARTLIARSRPTDVRAGCVAMEEVLKGLEGGAKASGTALLDLWEEAFRRIGDSDVSPQKARAVSGDLVGSWAVLRWRLDEAGRRKLRELPLSRNDIIDTVLRIEKRGDEYVGTVEQDPRFFDEMGGLNSVCVHSPEPSWKGREMLRLRQTAPGRYRGKMRSRDSRSFRLLDRWVEAEYRLEDGVARPLKGGGYLKALLPDSALDRPSMKEAGAYLTAVLKRGDIPRETTRVCRFSSVEIPADEAIWPLFRYACEKRFNTWPEEQGLRIRLYDAGEGSDALSIYEPEIRRFADASKKSGAKVTGPVKFSAFGGEGYWLSVSFLDNGGAASTFSSVQHLIYWRRGRWFLIVDSTDLPRHPLHYFDSLDAQKIYLKNIFEKIAPRVAELKREE